jgi:predicted Holliday junction resolvase-like endonuclease
MLNNISLSSLLLLFVIFLLVLLIIFQQIAMSRKLKKVRQDAVKRSNAVKGGQLAEQLAPFLPNFPCNPADAHFLGQPIDYIAFPGLCENGTVDEILLIEVKTNTSQLSGREKEIREAVKSGRIRYVEYRIN